MRGGSRNVGALLAGMAAAAVALTGAAPARAVAAGTNGAIIFENQVSIFGGPSYTHAFRILPNGSNERDLMSGRAVSVFDPTVSPDGTRVAYFEGGHIWVASALGRHPRELDPSLPPGVGEEQDPAAWSPDGTHLAVVRYFEHVPRSCGAPRKTGQFDVYVIPVSAQGQHVRITDSPCSTEYDPTWSPDGTTLAFERIISPGTPQATENIFTLPADGSGDGIGHQVTNSDADHLYGLPSWSPTRSLLLIQESNSTGSSTSLEKISPTATYGTPQPVTSPTNCPEVFQAVWSPDGKKIAATCYHSNGTTNQDDIITFSASGGGTADFVTTTGGEQPEWGGK